MLDSQHHHISMFLFHCPAGARFSGVIHANGRHRPRKHIFPAIEMRCCWDVLLLGCAAHWDVLLSGCAVVGMCCRQDALHVLTEAESPGEECKAWLLGKASLSR